MTITQFEPRKFFGNADNGKFVSRRTKKSSAELEFFPGLSVTNRRC